MIKIILMSLMAAAAFAETVTITNVSLSKLKQYAFTSGYTNELIGAYPGKDGDYEMTQLAWGPIELVWNVPGVTAPTQNDLNSITNAAEWVFSMRPTRDLEISFTNHVQEIVLLLNTIPAPPFDTLTLEPPYPTGTRETLAVLAESASNIFTNQEDKIRLNSLASLAIMEMFSLHEDGVQTDNNANLGK